MDQNKTNLSPSKLYVAFAFLVAAAGIAAEGATWGVCLALFSESMTEFPKSWFAVIFVLSGVPCFGTFMYVYDSMIEKATSSAAAA